MRTLFVMSVTLAVVCGVGSQGQADEPIRLLMVTQSQGFMHGSVKRKEGRLSPAEIAVKQLGQTSRVFTADCTQDCAADFTKENLKNYDVVVFYTTGDLPIATSDMDYFLKTWLTQKGHGFMGFHSATDTFKNSKPYWDMIGGTFNGHPWGSGNTVTISVHEPDHPTMHPFGSEFRIRDEIYQYKNWQPKKVRVLMSLNMARCKPKRPYMVPVAWCKSWGQGGRIYVNNLGHNPQTWTDKRFMKSVENGVKWVTGRLDGPTMPTPRLSAALEAKARSDTEGAAPKNAAGVSGE